MTPSQNLMRWASTALADRLTAIAARLAPPAQHTATNGVLPRSRVVKASFYFSLPAQATEAEIEEWVKFELGGGSLSVNSPLAEHELNLVGKVSLLDTGLHEHLRFEGTPQRFSVYTSLKPTPYMGPTSTDIVMNPNHPALQPKDQNG